MAIPTREQVTKWALDCDIIDNRDLGECFTDPIVDDLQRFAAIAFAAGQTAALEGLAQQEIGKMSLLADVSRRGVELGQKLEREACAKVCEDFADGTSAYEVHHRFAAYKCADLIRKRGEDESIF